MSPLEDADAFAEFYQRTHRNVFRYAAALSGNAADAEDLTAETFLRAWRRRATFYGDADAALGWVITIARHLVVDRQRAAHRVGAPSVRLNDDALHTETPNIDDALVASERLRLVLDTMRHLPDQQREAVVLRHVHGWRVNRIAAHLGVAENTVSVNLRRGIVRLQRMLVPMLVGLAVLVAASVLAASPEARAAALGWLGWHPVGAREAPALSRGVNLTTDPAAFAGSYSSEGPAASSPGRILRIDLGADGQVTRVPTSAPITSRTWSSSSCAPTP